MEPEYLDLDATEEPVETLEGVAPSVEATEEHEETAETAVETTETGEESAEQKAQDEHRSSTAGSVRQKELRKMAEQAHRDALELAEQYKQELDNLRAQLNPVKHDAEPKIDDFETLDEYVSAKANFVARKQLESYRYEQLEQQARQANMAEAQSWNQKLASEIGEKEENTDAVQEFTYFAQQVERNSPVVAQAAGNFIKESEAGPALVIALGKDPDLMQRLASLSPYKAVAELGKLEERILAGRKAQETKPKTNAPRPPAPVRAGSTAPAKDDGISFF